MNTKQTEALKLALHHIENGAHNRRYIRHVIREALMSIPDGAEPPKLILDAYRIDTEFFGLDENAKDHPNSVALYRLAEQPAQHQSPEYAWPTVADYERDVGFQTNEAFRIAWRMARTTNKMLGHASSQPAQPQESVAEVLARADNTGTFVKWKQQPKAGMVLYTSPQPAQPSKPWVGLELHEVRHLKFKSDQDWMATRDQELRPEWADVFASAIEAKLREKNT